MCLFIALYCAWLNQKQRCNIYVYRFYFLLLTHHNNNSKFENLLSIIIISCSILTFIDVFLECFICFCNVCRVQLTSFGFVAFLPLTITKVYFCLINNNIEGNEFLDSCTQFLLFLHIQHFQFHPLSLLTPG